MSQFDFYSQYYRLLYSGKDYAAEVKYVDELIHQNLPSGKTVLEFGSGTGTHGLLLQQKGYEVYGLERSESMVSIAKAEGFNCSVADISAFQLDHKFDIVLALFHVISYLTENDTLIQTFRNASSHLKEGGLFLFDIWYTPAVYYQIPETRKKEVEDDVVKVIRIAEPFIYYNRNVVDVNYHVIAIDKGTGHHKEIKEVHPMRHFSIPEIELLAILTGFRLLKAEEFLTGAQPSRDSWGVCFILQKL